jgi:type I restriction enzyme S subunit
VDRLAPEFLVALMASGHGRSYFQLTAKQTTNLASTNSTTLRAFPIIFPSLPEQEEILSRIRDDSETIDAAITRASNEINLLTEYRTRLTADVVTGKLDVREAAAALPEVDPLAADDEPDALDVEPDSELDELAGVEVEGP